MDTEFIAKRSPVRMGLMLLASIGFVVGSAWLIANDIPQGWKYWVVAAGIPFFGLCAVWIAMMVFAKGPEIAVGPRGILWRRWTGDYVPWSAIAAIHPVEVGPQPMLAVTLRDPDAYPLTGLLGKLQGANRSMMGGGDVFLTMVGTDRKFGELVAAVQRFAPGLLA